MRAGGEVGTGSRGGEGRGSLVGPIVSTGSRGLRRAPRVGGISQCDEMAAVLRPVFAGPSVGQ